MTESIYIINNSIIRFGIRFTIPASANINQIILNDSLISSLQYDISQATVQSFFIDNVDKTASFSSYFDITEKTQSVLVLASTAIFKNMYLDSDKDTVLVLIINTMIPELPETPFNQISNSFNYKIIFSDTTQIISQPVSTSMYQVKPYVLYGFGGSDMVKKDSNQRIVFPVHFPVINAFSRYLSQNSPQFQYIIDFEPNTAIPLFWPTIQNTQQAQDKLPEMIRVYLADSAGNNTMLLPYSPDQNQKGYYFDFQAYQQNKFKVIIPHFDELRNHTIYVVFFMETNDVPQSSSPIHSKASIQLYDNLNNVILQQVLLVEISTYYQNVMSTIDPIEELL